MSNVRGAVTYPNPLGYIYPNDLRTWIWIYNKNLIGKDALAIRHQYKNPLKRNDETATAYRDWSWSYNKNLTGKDKQFRDSGQWTTYYYPNPTAYPRPDYTFVSPPPLTLKALPPVPFKNVWPNPPPVTWYREWATYLNQSTLFVPPFSQLDWPNPKPVTWYRDWSDTGNALTPTALLPLPFDWGTQEKQAWYREWFQTGNSLSSSVVTVAPFSQLDWPNSRDPREKRSWEAWYNLNLIGRDIVPGKSYTDRPPPVSWYRDQSLPVPPGSLLSPFRQTDYPNPQPVTWYRDWSQSPKPVVVVVTTPFNQFDWPNPSRLTWYQSWLQSSQVPPVPYLPLPFDWGTQEKLQWYRDWSQNPAPLRSVVVVQAPFNQLDWPIPRDPREKRSWEWNYNLNLIGKDIVPGQFLTGRPDPVIWYQNWIQGPIPPPPPLPFNQYDWPNPKDPRDKRAWEWWYNLNLIGQDQLPVGTITTARTPLGNTWYIDWSQNLQELTLRTSAFPINQSDWPLPYPVYWFRDYNQNLILVAPSSIPPIPPVVATPSGRVPPDYPHTWTWTDVEIPPAYRAVWKDEYNKNIVSEAAARLGRKGGIASGVSRRK